MDSNEQFMIEIYPDHCPPNAGLEVTMVFKDLITYWIYYGFILLVPSLQFVHYITDITAHPSTKYMGQDYGLTNLHG